MDRAKGFEFDQVMVTASAKTIGPLVDSADLGRLAYVALPQANRPAAAIWIL